MIEDVETVEIIEELKKSTSIKIEIQLSAREAYSLIVAFQTFKTTHKNLEATKIIGEIAARKLNEKLRVQFPRIYIFLNNAWNLTDSKPENPE